MAKISVIIPVFNVEEYLEQCLESVINQTLKDIEIILIDDGSTDSSINICEKYRKNDNRIKFIAQKNQGSGAARNRGLDTANGEFVIFLDSDDFYPESDILETLYNKAKEHNVKICGGSFSELDNDTILTKFPEDNSGYVFAQDGLIEYADYQFDYGYHRFIYNLEFLKNNNIKFPDYRRFQDPPFFVKVMFAAQRFYAISKITYCLRIKHKMVNWKRPQQIGLINGIKDNLDFAKEHNLKVLYYLTLMRLNQHSTAFFHTDLSVIYELYKLLKSIDIDFIKDKFPDFQFNRCFCVLNLIIWRIFSLKNIGCYKVLTVLGMSFYFKRNRRKCNG